MGDLADRTLARTQPLLDPDHGPVLPALIGALTGPAELVWDIARDDDTHISWAKVMDPAAAPAELLPWLALFPGVPLPVGISEQEQRDRIAQAAGFYSGTDRAMREEVQRTLTGAKTVRLIKSDIWHEAILTRTAETPDPGATGRAAVAQKPAGIVLTFIVSDLAIIDEGTRTIDTGVGDLDTALPADVT
jgi:hypothetical protein